MFKKIISPLIAAVILAAAVTVPVFADEEENAKLLPILMYHQINPSSKYWGDYTVSPATFEGDLKYLNLHGYTSVTLRQLVAYAHGEGTLPEKPVLITFDDGQESFAAYGLPLLEKYQMHAVMAIIGRCADIFTKTEDHNLIYSYLSWPQVAQLVKSPFVELAVHTYDMHTLGARRGCIRKKCESLENYNRSFNADLEKVENSFQQYTGTKPFAFAYPYGFYSKEAKDVLYQRGYTVLLGCKECVNRLTGTPEELLDLGRFNRPNGADRQRYFKKMGIV